MLVNTSCRHCLPRLPPPLQQLLLLFAGVCTYVFDQNSCPARNGRYESILVGVYAVIIRYMKSVAHRQSWLDTPARLPLQPLTMQTDVNAIRQRKTDERTDERTVVASEASY